MASPDAVAAAASSVNAAAFPSPNFRFSRLFLNNFVYAASRLPDNLPFQRNHRLGSLAICFSRRQKHGSSPSRHDKPPPQRKKKQFLPKNHDSKEDELDEDAFEALFKQLEEDLRNDDSSFDDIDDDISEEDLAKLEEKLAEALGDDELLMSMSNAEATGHDDDAKVADDNSDDDDGDVEDDDDSVSEVELSRLEGELAEALGDDDAEAGDENDEASISKEDLARLERELAEALGDDDDDDVEATDETEDDNDNVDGDDDIERPIELKRWQLRRLATALKYGRRKTGIKNLSAELCLERAVVLKLLRDPPPNLLMISAMLPDEDPEPKGVPENRTDEVATPGPVQEAIEYNTPPKVKAPLHVMLRNWSSQKRLKKAQVDTLERVYRRTKRPTNAMISSIVHVTSLPRKKIIKWFEDKRNEDGVPDRRLPYERPVPNTVG